MTKHATSIAMPAAPAAAPAAEFARVCALILDLMSLGAPGSKLREYLHRAMVPLRLGEVVLASENATVQVNGAEIGTRAHQTWHALMMQHRVQRVSFAADATERELLQFLALLVTSPSTPSRSFADLWHELGAWRIHAKVDSDVSETGSSTQPAAQRLLAEFASATRAREFEAEEIFLLCREVLTGAAVGDNTALGNALRAAGARSTEALLLLLAESTSGSQRRMLYEAILEIKDGYAHLIAALGHPSWFVARNAAALLGECEVESAGEALASLLTHDDFRVRQASATALGALQTSNALVALEIAVVDRHGRVREAAWRAWTHSVTGPSAAALSAGLRGETEESVQRALLDCAAAHPCLDVNLALVRFCARKCLGAADPDLLIYAVELLSQRKPQAAIPFTRRLADAWPAGTPRGAAYTTQV